MAEDLSKKRPAELREHALSPELGYDTIDAIDEMVRRFEEVDNCICWGVDCVHQAKELDKSYSEHQQLRARLDGREAVLLECVNRLGQYVGMCRCPGKACVEACDECDKTQAIINGVRSLLARK
jgi:hypothetical protein